VPQKRARIIYSGTVQGVGFRFTAERIANSLALTGWVANRPDGGVEVLCEGGENNIETFMNEIKKALSRYIRSANVTREEATGEFDSFGIKFLH